MVALLGVGSRQTAEMCIVPEGKLGAKVSQGVSRPRASPGALYQAVQQLLASRLLCERTAAAAARPDTLKKVVKSVLPEIVLFVDFFHFQHPACRQPLPSPRPSNAVWCGSGWARFPPPPPPVSARSPASMGEVYVPATAVVTAGKSRVGAGL